VTFLEWPIIVNTIARTIDSSLWRDYYRCAFRSLSHRQLLHVSNTDLNRLIAAYDVVFIVFSCLILVHVFVSILACI